MLEATDLACTRGTRRLFEAVSFVLPRGEVLRVRGENGSGKTSLLRILAGLSPAAHGEVRWNDRPIRRQREEYAAEMVFIGHSNALKDDLTAAENLRYAAALAGVAASRVRIGAALAEEGLARAADLPVQWLSQGQKRRVALVRLALCGARRLWILDEPFSGLDRGAVTRLAARVSAHVRDGGVVVYTTHQEIDLCLPGRNLDLQ